MEEFNSNITSFVKDNFFVSCKNDSVNHNTVIVKEYIDNDCKYRLNIVSELDKKKFSLEYDLKVDNFPYLDSSYSLYVVNGISTIIFKYPGVNNNSLCLISGEIDEDRDYLLFIIKDADNEYKIMQRKNNGILSLSYQTLTDKFGIFISNYRSTISEDYSDSIVSHIALEIDNKTFIYEKSNKDSEEIFYEILKINDNELDYDTKVLYRNTDNGIMDKDGNILLPSGYCLFDIVIKPYMDKLNNYVGLVLDQIPDIDKRLFQYDNMLINRGYDDYLFPNIKDDLNVKDFIKKIRKLKK